jgi:hypothetical protein
MYQTISIPTGKFGRQAWMIWGSLQPCYSGLAPPFKFLIRIFQKAVWYNGMGMKRMAFESTFLSDMTKR